MRLKNDGISIASSDANHLFVLSSREHAGKGIGATLIRRAATEAQASGSRVLRVDCWADAPDLVAWYESQGFMRSDTFTVGTWRNQVFEMRL